MKSLFFIIGAFIFLPSFLVSQIVVDNSTPYDSPIYLVDNILLSAEIQASNHNFQGDPIQIGFFDGTNSNLGFESGLVLSTGDIASLNPSFTGISAGVSVVPVVTDPDLLNVANSVPPLIEQNFSLFGIFDVAVLEFEFIPTSNEISFRYIFATAEYFGFENTEYNDVFGFFISGPGIAGPYASPPAYPDGSINLATFESQEANSLGQDLPITVSSVNTNYNNHLFIENQQSSQTTISSANGFTVPMTATAQVQCGETYHIRLAIADGSDAALSSYVFIDGSSFSSSNGLITNNTNQDTTHIIVDCGTEVTLSAVIESDYDILWNTGQTTTSINVEEGSYWYQASNESCEIFSDTVVVEWSSVGAAIQDTNICESQNIVITPASVGQAPFTYLWNTGQTTSEISVGPGQYSVTTTDANSCKVVTEINIRSIESPTAEIIGEGRFCEGDPFVSVPLKVKFSGHAPFSFEYTDGVNTYIEESNGLEYTIPATSFGQYQLTALSDANCPGTFSGISPILKIPLPKTNLSGGGIICPGDSSKITLTVETEFMPYNLYLNNGHFDRFFSNIDHSSFSFYMSDSATYAVSKVVDSQGCESVDNANEVVVSFKEIFNPDITNSVDSILCAVDPPIKLHALTSGGVWRGKGVGFDNYFHPINAYLGQNWIYYSFPANCNETDSIMIEVGCHLQIFIPNSFTPNGDFINDVFELHGKNVINFEMSIYNRWGQELFYTNNIDTSWNGKYKGQIVQTGVYSYHFKAYGKDAQIVNKSGTLSLIK